MIRTMSRVLAIGLCLLANFAWAANEGQADLDKAADLKLEAENAADLEKIAMLCESALKKGLDAENTAFANQMLSGVLLQHAQKYAEAIFTPMPDRRWQLARQTALKDLERATKADPKLAEAYLLIVKLQVLPGGDIKAARSAADKAVESLSDDKQQLAKAYVLRGQLSEDTEQQLADYDNALKADPKCAEALQSRALMHMTSGANEKAVDDLLKLIDIDSENLAAQGAVAEALAQLEKFDDALKHVETVIKLNPKSPAGYALRARVYVLQDKLKEAIADLDAALKIDPENVGALLLRGQANAELKNYDQAKADVEKALQIRPDLTQAILVRSMIAASAKKYAEAIADIKTLLQADPQNTQLRLQLGGLYAADNRPRKAIEVFTQILENDDANWQARRNRADALLSVGKHKEAIEDYDVALKAQPDDSHMLNNLAWVLATSPDDEVRDADRAIEIAKRGCDATKYEAPHILSTLAAAYAEKGDWETAIKWSSKAVELDEKGDEVSEQLKKELDGYKAKKPWREKQNIEENPKPLDEKDGDLEA